VSFLEEIAIPVPIPAWYSKREGSMNTVNRRSFLQTVAGAALVAHLPVQTTAAYITPGYTQPVKPIADWDIQDYMAWSRYQFLSDPKYHLVIQRAQNVLVEAVMQHLMTQRPGDHNIRMVRTLCNDVLVCGNGLMEPSENDYPPRLDFTPLNVVQYHLGRCRGETFAIACEHLGNVYHILKRVVHVPFVDRRPEGLIWSRPLWEPGEPRPTLSFIIHKMVQNKVRPRLVQAILDILPHANSPTAPSDLA